ncbi:unnamed protein product [Periconia digitata]|uniref:Uncharacterized protein n=1 Tax=Periconia digitata TaxID=1303443 RepID=A0A9W4UE57_9PLEO|nr:unnamed protein product [Periconia digitata]
MVRRGRGPGSARVSSLWSLISHYPASHLPLLPATSHGTTPPARRLHCCQAHPPLYHHHHLNPLSLQYAMALLPYTHLVFLCRATWVPSRIQRRVSEGRAFGLAPWPRKGLASLRRGERIPPGSPP